MVRAARRARSALALLLAAGGLAAVAPVAASDSAMGMRGAGGAATGDHVAPGQARLAAATAQPPAAVPQVPAASKEAPSSETKQGTPSKTAAASDPSRASAQSDAPKSSKPSRSARPPKSPKPPKPPKPAKPANPAKPSKPLELPEPSPPPEPSQSAQPAGGGLAAAAAPAVAGVQAALDAPPAPDIPAAPATTPITPPPADTADVTTGSGRRSRASGGRSETLARAATRRAALAATTTAATATGPVGAPAGARRDAPAAGSPLTRTVVRVLEVIPFWMRVALAILAGLGVLLGTLAVVQTIRRRRLERQRRVLIADVGVLQSALLPELPERIGGARVTAAYRPAAGLAGGGDFYDAFELPGGRTAVLVGDIAGHGRDVVPLTALVRYNLRAYLEAGLTPRATLDVASHVLAQQLGGRQVTIVAAIFDPGTGRLTYACAGHWPPLLLGATPMLVTACSSPPIGVGAPTGRRQTTIPLVAGTGVCFYTDGLSEVPVGSGRLGREGIAEELGALGPEADAADLVARIVRRSDRQPDDMAACILTALPPTAERWSLRLEEFEVDAAALYGGWAERFLVACGVGRPHIVRALREAHTIVGYARTAVIEVRVGEALVEVRVAPPAAVTLPIARRTSSANDLAATA